MYNNIHYVDQQTGVINNLIEDDLLDSTIIFGPLTMAMDFPRQTLDLRFIHCRHRRDPFRMDLAHR